ncbi:MAG: hypothetical protein NTY20_00115 [Candidatus Aenigmarchaeota archaeon]|nr:hypothetical protein [Candidatus Aenigmarchaeota archaeon]
MQLTKFDIAKEEYDFAHSGVDSKNNYSESKKHLEEYLKENPYGLDRDFAEIMLRDTNSKLEKIKV